MPLTLLPVAADVLPWYQDPSFLGFCLAIAGSIAAATWSLARVHFHRRIERIEEERDELMERVQELERDADGRDGSAEIVHDLEQQVMSSQEAERLAAAEADRLKRRIEALSQNLKTAGRMGGLTWRAKLADDAPPFVPPGKKRPPIIAVLNLKGGVGKTTIAANVAAALARSDQRVLLVDLDLQASLSSMFVSTDQLQQAASGRRLVQHLLEQSASGARPRLADFLLPTRERGIDLLGSSDSLAYAEINLTVQWFLQPGRGDVRLILRQALHDGAAERFDAVLIDCPPILNVSCVNALAAADFVLVPILPSKSSTDRVSPMLVQLRALRNIINPDLKILGVVANRTERAPSLTSEERNLWSALRTDCHTAWGDPVPMCDRWIPRNVAIRNAEAARRPLDAGDDVFACFQELVHELTARFPPRTTRPVVTGATR